MVDHRQMLIIREYRNVLRILTADRQTAQHGQKTCLYVAAVDGYALHLRIAQNICFSSGEKRKEHAAPGNCALAQGRNSLDLFNLRHTVTGRIGKYIDHILLLIH